MNLGLSTASKGMIYRFLGHDYYLYLIMAGTVWAISYGLSLVQLKRFEILGQLIAGFVIFLSGLVIQVMGL